MTALAQRVEINRRFARSARIDADLNGTPPLIGYVLQASVAKALSTMAAAQIESHQGAFTWTGPYGGGKSSAALLVANLIAGSEENRKIARKLAGKPLAGLYAKAFPQDGSEWSVVAVTGARIRLRDAIAEAASIALRWDAPTTEQGRASDEELIGLLLGAAADQGGVLLILDELGKLLEHEALEGGDIHLLQDIAEHASRSQGRLIVVGILHQSFDQYAARAARDARQEWAKVQGRYQDIAFLSGADETVALLGRAITSADPPEIAATRAAAVAHAVAKRRPTEVDLLSEALAATWPLNPVTSLLLGPVSRQRFAQNERSVFGFLSSAEPWGFQDFLLSAGEDETYDPARLWDYLASNFGMALASGGDGGRFSLAFEAIERASAKGSRLHVELTKAAAIIEFFRNGSGLALADDILAEAVPWAGARARQEAIAELLDWAVLIRQPRLGGYALFAGSDFDLDDAISRAIAPVDASVLAGIPQRVGFGFATAKRHYFDTGTLRTFDIALQLIGDGDEPAKVAEEIAARKARGSGSMVLLLNDGTLDKGTLDARCKSVARALKPRTIVAAIGAVADSHALRASAAELIAVERVFREHPQLEGDRIARREIAARQSSCIDQLHRSLEGSLERARWWLAPNPAKAIRETPAVVASILADEGFPSAPILKSELLQRDRPSSNSMAALRELCHAMVTKPTAPNLGIEGYPAEMGLYLTVLKPFGLHAKTEVGGFDFCGPNDSVEGHSLRPAWDVLADGTDIELAKVYAAWAQAPFGLKAGIMPVLTLAYLMANRDRIAVYIDGTFQTAFDDVFVDKMLQKPDAVRLRRIDRSVRETAFLSGLAVLLEIDDEGASLPVAQALYQRFEQLPAYALRTDGLSDGARLVRGVVTNSSDPEALLFDDLPAALADRLSAELVVDALRECEDAYPRLLSELRIALARSLGVDAASFAGVAKRANTVKELTNDYNFDAFAMRAAAFEQEEGDIEGLVSILLHKPALNWSDRDRDQALIEMARFGRRFRELEALAVVRDRRSETEALALVVGVDPLIPPLLQSFELTELEKQQAAILAERILKSLGSDRGQGHIQLAALARAVATLAADASLADTSVESEAA
jgi:hypothetical protein